MDGEDSDVCVSVELLNPLVVFVIQIGEFNPAFEQFLKFINGVRYKGNSKVMIFFSSFFWNFDTE